MHFDPDNFSLPTGVTEQDLLAFIEFEDVAPAARGAIEADPSLMSLVIALRDDRTAVASLPPFLQAHADLVTPAVREGERQMLLDLEREASSATTIPVSRVQPQRESVIARIVNWSFAPRLAMAAALLLTVSLGSWVVWQVVSDGFVKAPRTALRPDDDRVVPDLPEQPVRVATDTPVDPVVPTPDVPEVVTVPPVAVADAAPQVVPVMDVDRALALARDGRLAIIVESRSFDAALVHVEHTLREVNFGRIDSSSPALFASLTRSLDQLDIDIADRSPMGPVIADDGSSGLQLPVVKIPAGQKAMYLADVRSRSRELKALRTTLANSGRRVRFVELPERVESELSLDPDAVLWWTRGSGNWVHRVRVPIIVEQVR